MPKISVTEAAARMGITPQALRMGLRHGRFPFGTAVQMSKRWVYYISRERFERWMSGADMTVAVGEVMTATESRNDNRRRLGAPAAAGSHASRA